MRDLMTLTPRLLDVRDVAKLLKCSTRTVYRLSDGGILPRPRKLGALVRWSEIEIQAWVDSGCKPVRPVSRGGGK